MGKAIEITENAIKCDNPQCDFVVHPMIKHTGYWVDMPCPKCGENLLTEEDFKRFMQALYALNEINDKYRDLPETPPEERRTFRLDTHNKISIEETNNK